MHRRVVGEKGRRCKKKEVSSELIACEIATPRLFGIFATSHLHEKVTRLSYFLSVCSSPHSPAYLPFSSACNYLLLITHAHRISPLMQGDSDDLCELIWLLSV